MSTQKNAEERKLAAQLDLRGLMCPEPVLRTKKVLEEKPEGAIEVLVDSDINVMNLRRLANSLGLSLQSKESQAGFEVVIGVKEEEEKEGVSKIEHSHSAADQSRTSNAKAAKAATAAKSGQGETAKTSVVFIAKETFGEGDRDFSVNLINVFLQTILQAGHRPQAILLANSGVKLLDPDSSVSKVLSDFQKAGVDVFACGLCVEFYGLKDKIAKEQITNMYAICEYLFSADKVISP